MANEPITSLQNQRVKDLVRLREKRHRQKQGLFLLEGKREIERAVAANILLHQVYAIEEHQAWVENLTSVDFFLCTEPVMQKISYREKPEGIVAVANIPEAEWPKGDTPLFLIAEAIEKPGNLGALLRSADAAGATALLLADPTVDLYHPNVIRTSTGTIFSLPVVQADNETLLRELRERGVRLIAASPDAENLFTEEPLDGPVGIVVGSEAEGLSPFWLEACDRSVRIPMLGSADSLNVATAATLLLYEVVRQRSS